MKSRNEEESSGVGLILGVQSNYMTALFPFRRKIYLNLSVHFLQSIWKIQLSHKLSDWAGTSAYLKNGCQNGNAIDW